MSVHNVRILGIIFRMTTYELVMVPKVLRLPLALNGYHYHNMSILTVRMFRIMSQIIEYELVMVPKILGLPPNHHQPEMFNAWLIYQYK
jgi:hypothetical protein